jgi:alpha-tubulin suppressor-like RCC1 family protein
MLNEFGNFMPHLQSLPLELEELARLDVVHVAAGYGFSVLVTRDGDAYSWGFNEKGQLGHGFFYNLDRPRRIEWFTKNGVRVVKVACGQQHTMFLSDKGMIYTCGLGGKREGKGGERKENRK